MVGIDYKKFYEYFIELYGTGLEVINWHYNGEPEPLDNFIEEATEYMENEFRL